MNEFIAEFRKLLTMVYEDQYVSQDEVEKVRKLLEAYQKNSEVRWVNIYNEKLGDVHVMELFASKEFADKHSENRMACVPITIEY